MYSGGALSTAQIRTSQIMRPAFKPAFKGSRIQGPGGDLQETHGIRYVFQSTQTLRRLEEGSIRK